MFIEDSSKINDEIRLTLTSAKNEDIAVYVEKWIEKYYSIKAKVKFSVKYDPELLNHKECPLNGKLNTRRRCSLPKWYPGYSGKFEIYFVNNKELNSVDGYLGKEKRFKRILFGGSKVYEKYKEAGLKEDLLTINCIYSRNINKGNNWMFGEIYFFVDDFPNLCNNVRNGGVL